jgi:wyosine [tRNA(Phe)-imidazoG37] synthetase (radical SAM superfamily)
MNEIKKTGTVPQKEDLLAAIGRDLAVHNQNKLQIDTLAIVGNGEPTLHPDFDDLAKEIARMRDEYFPGTPISILTNGANLDQRKVLAGLKFVDKKIVKLDAGGDKLIKLINRPLVKESAESLISGARKLQGVVIQSFFVQGAVDNTKNEDIDEWMEAVGMIRPELVQIYSLDRIPATSGLKKPDEDTLYTIAAKLEKRTRLSWKVFY